MKNESRFWDRIAAKYSRQPIADQGAYQIKLDITREYLRPEMQVLEFGCGTGSTALAHAPYVKHIHAIDVSAKMLEIAQAKADEDRVKNVSFEQADMDSFEVADASFDAVLGLSILHLLEDRRAAIAKVYDMLKPDGVFVSSTACLGDTMAFFKYIAPAGKFFGLMPLVTAFTIQELTNSLTNAGFKIVHQWQPARGKSVFIVAKKVNA